MSHIRSVTASSTAILFGLILLVGCGRGEQPDESTPSLREAASETATTSPASPSSPRHIEIPVVEGSPVALILASGQGYKGSFLAPATGDVRAIAFQIATAGEVLDGALHVQICAATTCLESMAPLEAARDNEFFPFPLSSALAVAEGQEITYVLSRAAGEIPLVVWSFDRAQSVAAPLILVDGTPSPKALRIRLEY
jgi:hypothetical protein